jgi:hypothetical protein
MRLHVGVRMLAAATAAAAISAPSAYGFVPRASGVNGGSATPAVIQHHHGGSGDPGWIGLAAVGAVGLAGAGYGARRRVGSATGARARAAGG